jgi:maleylpyruvate isomerase
MDSPMSMRVYGFWRSLASFRVRVALKIKGIQFDEIAIDILRGEQFEQGYADINAERVVPTLVHEDYSVFQSLAIMEYLDDIQPAPRLIPRDAKERAYARSLALVAVADAHPLITPRVCNHLAKVFGADAQAIESWRKHWTSEGLATYERLLTRRAPAPFALGEEPCVADICIAGQVIAAQFFKIGLAEFPLVGELAERCFALPAFATSHPHEQPGYRISRG